MYLDPELTGLGLGHRIIEAGGRRVATTWPEVTTLVADILPGNDASAAAFAHAGYARQATRWTRAMPT